MLRRPATLPMAAVGVASRRRGLWRLLLLMVILAVLASYVSPVRTYLGRSGQIQQERLITEDISRQHEQLLQERERLQSTDYVEKVARRDLGLVRPGEQPYVVKDLDKEEGENQSAPASGEEPSLIDRFGDWLGSILP